MRLNMLKMMILVVLVGTVSMAALAVKLVFDDAREGIEVSQHLNSLGPLVDQEFLSIVKIGLNSGSEHFKILRDSSGEFEYVQILESDLLNQRLMSSNFDNRNNEPDTFDQDLDHDRSEKIEKEQVKQFLRNLSSSKLIRVITDYPVRLSYFKLLSSTESNQESQIGCEITIGLDEPEAEISRQHMRDSWKIILGRHSSLKSTYARVPGDTRVILMSYADENPCMPKFWKGG